MNTYKSFRALAQANNLQTFYPTTEQFNFAMDHTYDPGVTPAVADAFNQIIISYQHNSAGAISVKYLQILNAYAHGL